MEISEKLDAVQRKVSASKKSSKREMKSGTADLFGAESFESSVPGPNVVDPVEIDGFWLQYLTEGTKRVGEAEMANLLESTGWMPSDFQASLLRLIAAGDLKNLDAVKPRRTRPLHYEKNGERLALTQIQI